MAAQMMGSQFPLVPMVKVKGLNSQATTHQIRVLAGTPRSSRMASMNNPTSKSAPQRHQHRKNSTETVVLYCVDERGRGTCGGEDEH